jgi:hypothetical protein
MRCVAQREQSLPTELDVGARARHRGFKGRGNMIHQPFSRRRLLTGASVATAAAVLRLPRAPALAKSEMPSAQAPYMYRFKLGDAQATIISDGVLPLGAPGEAFLGLSAQEINKELTDNSCRPTRSCSNRTSWC